jgi:hypothetical protein
VAASDILLFEVKTAVVLPIHLSGTEKSEVQVRERLFFKKNEGNTNKQNCWWTTRPPQPASSISKLIRLDIQELGASPFGKQIAKHIIGKTVRMSLSHNHMKILHLG